MSDKINPKYYTLPSGIQVWQVVGHLDKLRGDAVAYILRAGQKGNEAEDLEKAIKSLQLRLDYLNLLTERYKINDDDELSELLTEHLDEVDAKFNLEAGGFSKDYFEDFGSDNIRGVK